MSKRIALVAATILALGAAPAFAAEQTGNGSGVGPGPGVNTNTNPSIRTDAHPGNTDADSNVNLSTGFGRGGGNGGADTATAAKEWSEYNPNFMVDWGNLTPEQRDALMNDPNAPVPPNVNPEFQSQWTALNAEQRAKLKTYQNPLTRARPDEKPAADE